MKLPFVSKELDELKKKIASFDHQFKRVSKNVERATVAFESLSDKLETSMSTISRAIMMIAQSFNGLDEKFGQIAVAFESWSSEGISANVGGKGVLGILFGDAPRKRRRIVVSP